MFLFGIPYSYNSINTQSRSIPNFCDKMNQPTSIVLLKELQTVQERNLLQWNLDTQGYFTAAVWCWSVNSKAYTNIVNDVFWLVIDMNLVGVR